MYSNRDIAKIWHASTPPKQSPAITDKQASKLALTRVCMHPHRYRHEHTDPQTQTHTQKIHRMQLRKYHKRLRRHIVACTPTPKKAGSPGNMGHDKILSATSHIII